MTDSASTVSVTFEFLSAVQVMREVRVQNVWGQLPRKADLAIELDMFIGHAYEAVEDYRAFSSKISDAIQM